jgi:hypothetical protein
MEMHNYDIDMNIDKRETNSIAAASITCSLYYPFAHHSLVTTTYCSSSSGGVAGMRESGEREG